MLSRAAGLALLLVAPTAPDQAMATGRTFMSYAEARPILEALTDALPNALRGLAPPALAAAWPGWAEARDREIRARLVQGAEDSVAHLMLFGTSFTHEDRITVQDLSRLGSGASEEKRVADRLAARIHDLALAAGQPGGNERLAFVRQVLEKNGGGPSTAGSTSEAWLYENLKRVLREDEGYAQALAAAKALRDPSAEFVERSRLFRTRGLSCDTSLLPNFAIEESLRDLLARNLLRPGSVRRVAVVGPGLDFTDKDDGFDFYPQQTLQPFAVVDSLLRLGLAVPGGPEVVTFDLNPQVTGHLEQAVAAARRARAYVIQLPRDAKAAWTPAAVHYWETFGDRISQSLPPAAVPPGFGDMKTRAVRVRPEVVGRMTPSDLDVVLERPVLGGGVAFDLVIATNVLVYYDTFEQSLALANIAAMLRPGGILLSNNVLLELPAGKMRSRGYRTVVYSDRPGHGDHVVFYQREAE